MQRYDSLSPPESLAAGITPSSKLANQGQAIRPGQSDQRYDGTARRAAGPPGPAAPGLPPPVAAHREVNQMSQVQVFQVAARGSGPGRRVSDHGYMTPPGPGWVSHSHSRQQC
eukprot:732591-Hanusia_phi.AAC.1